MLEVIASSPLDEQWEERDAWLEEAAGRPSDFACADKSMRQHRWLVTSRTDAEVLKARLELVTGVSVTVEEHAAPAHKRYKR